MSTNTAGAQPLRQQDEISTLKSMVSDVLSKKGVLNRLKAELRANIFTVLQEKQAEHEQLKAENIRLTKVKQTREGKLILDMITEFLEYFDLQQTNSVYSAEAGLPAQFDPALKGIIQQEIKLNSSASTSTETSDEPLLLLLLRQYELMVKNSTLKSNTDLARKTSLGSNVNLGSGMMNLSKENLAGAGSKTPQRKVVLSEDELVVKKDHGPNIDLLPVPINPVMASPTLEISRLMTPPPPLTALSATVNSNTPSKLGTLPPLTREEAKDDEEQSKDGYSESFEEISEDIEEQLSSAHGSDNNEDF